MEALLIMIAAFVGYLGEVAEAILATGYDETIHDMGSGAEDEKRYYEAVSAATVALQRIRRSVTIFFTGSIPYCCCWAQSALGNRSDVLRPYAPGLSRPGGGRDDWEKEIVGAFQSVIPVGRGFPHP